MESKKSCQYCNKEIHESTIRCDECHEAWVDGMKHGENLLKQQLKELLGSLIDLAKPIDLPIYSSDQKNNIKTKKGGCNNGKLQK